MDRDAIQAFMERFMEMVTGAAVLGIVGLGDRTGLFAGLAGQGPLTLAQIVERTGLNERYLREALASLAAAEILSYDASAGTYLLPDEHAACLADETSPYFLAGWAQMIRGVNGVMPGLERAWREGGGVPYSDYDEDMAAGIDRTNSPGMRVLLTRKWLPAMPDVVARLEEGIAVADVGCGSGTSSIAMAKTYPHSSVLGIDVDPTSIARARRNAETEALPNLKFEEMDAGSLPQEPGFDLITTFDVIHDLARPRAVLGQIRQALAPGGAYLMVEPNAKDSLEENLGREGALLYAISTMYCTTVSLAHDGEGLGAAWGPALAEKLCREAGFGSFERLEIRNPFNAFYRVEG